MAAVVRLLSRWAIVPALTGSASKTFTLKVQEAPAFTSADHATATVGVVFCFAVTATSYPTPTISKSGALPKGLTYHSGTRTIDGTPTAATQGSHLTAFTAKNSSGTVQQIITLTVN